VDIEPTRIGICRKASAFFLPSWLARPQNFGGGSGFFSRVVGVGFKPGCKKGQVHWLKQASIGIVMAYTINNFARTTVLEPTFQGSTTRSLF